MKKLKEELFINAEEVYGKELIDKFYDVVNNLFIMIQRNGKENEKL